MNRRRPEEAETVGQHSKTPHTACFALEMTARPCSAATGRSKSLLGRAAVPLGARNHRSSALLVFGSTRKCRPSVSARSRGSSKRRWIRQRFRVSCGIPSKIPFGIALLWTLHCLEMCFARLHRHRQMPYANLVFIYIYIYMCVCGGLSHYMIPIVFLFLYK